MKIIISHDVDHLYSTEHWLHDLIIPKHWVRTFIYLLKKQINAKVFFHRMFLPFKKKWNNIEEILKFDKKHTIPSTFFFGMASGCGMSYNVRMAKKMIQYVRNQEYDVGVHGIAFEDCSEMQTEYKRFKDIVGEISYGIRMHYVRKDENTLEKLDEIGYWFDSSDFDRDGSYMAEPYRINQMWEIPLHIMEGYVLKVGDMEQSKRNTLRILDSIKEKKLPYCTILFHDFYYNVKCYPQEKEWYEWLIRYLKKCGYEFISFKDAVEELENNSGCKDNRVCK